MARNESVNLSPDIKEFNTNEDNHISKISLKDYAKSISHQNNLRSHMPSSKKLNRSPEALPLMNGGLKVEEPDTIA